MEVKRVERTCKNCGGSHPSYECPNRVDIEARSRKYLEELKKEKPEVEERRRILSSKPLPKEALEEMRSKYAEELRLGKFHPASPEEEALRERFEVRRQELRNEKELKKEKPEVEERRRILSSKPLPNEALEEMRAKHAEELRLGKFHPASPEEEALRERFEVRRQELRNEIEKVAIKVIDENKTAVSDYKKGKIAVLQFLVDQVMKETNNRAIPGMVSEILKKLLK